MRLVHNGKEYEGGKRRVPGTWEGKVKGIYSTIGKRGRRDWRVENEAQMREGENKPKGIMKRKSMPVRTHVAYTRSK